MSLKIEPPDFDLMFSLADKIRELTKKRIRLEVEIKFKETDTVNTVMNDPAYLQGGKQPSMSFVESTFKYAGIGGCIIPLRNEMADVSAELEHARLTFDILKMQFDFYRTESANTRGLIQ